MKKILTASLVAMMAVTAANANIASTKYVEDRTGTVTFTADSIKGSANLTAAVETLAGTVATNASDASAAANQALTDAKAYTDALANGAVADNTAAIAGMDLASVGADGSYIKTVSQADGKVTATAEAADAAPTENSTKMVTSGGVYEAIEAAKTAATDANSELAGRVTTAEGKITTIEGQQTTQDGKISALETSLASGATKQAIDAAKKAGDDAQATIDAYKTSNDQALADGLVLKEDVANKATTEYTERSTTQYPSIKIAEDIANKAVASSKVEWAASIGELDGRLDGVEGDVDGILNEQTGILAQANKHSDVADTAQTTALQQYADQAEADAITAAKTETTTQVNALANGAVKANTEAIAALDSTYAKDADVESAIATAKGEAIADAKAETTSQVTALANGAVKTNTDAIDALEASLADGGDTDARFDAVEATANAAQVKSTADFQLGNKEGKWTTIDTYYAGLPSYCSTGTCSLVSKDGKVQWEKVEY